MLKKMLFLLFFSLSGCAVYGGGYESPGYGRYEHRYNDGYRGYYASPPIYVPGYYYEERRYDYRQDRRYLPPPPRYVQPPRYHEAQPPRWQPRNEHYRDSRRYEQRGGGISRGGWERSDRRYSQGRDQQPRGLGEHRR
ncbi:hypothetical protein [Pseudomonas sp. C11]|uniref:hypothetical protein n=1 Tax=Pseudomonas sp. C11 TaxID=3075550 RepID=UPI002AFEB02C|nr:hypothetical protein [Pseudomonas sp. C11]